MTRVRGTATRRRQNLVNSNASRRPLPLPLPPIPRCSETPPQGPGCNQPLSDKRLGTVIPPVCPPGPSTRPPDAHESYQFPLRTGTKSMYSAPPALLCAVLQALRPRKTPIDGPLGIYSLVVCCMPSTSCMCRVTNSACRSIRQPFSSASFSVLPFFSPSDPIRSIEPLPTPPQAVLLRHDAKAPTIAGTVKRLG